MAITKGIQQLMHEARARIQTLTLEEANAALNDTNTQFVDIRDIRELQREGQIPNALHAPRGMLEFWVDPQSPYYKEVFGEDRRFILYCQSSWRSSLAVASLVDMGMTNVCHFDGGFKAWKDAGLPVTEKSGPKS